MMFDDAVRAAIFMVVVALLFALVATGMFAVWRAAGWL